MNRSPKFRALAQLSGPSTAIVDEPQLAFLGGGVELSFDIEFDGPLLPYKFIFSRTSAMRFCAERVSNASYLDFYDVLVEVEPSGWTSELSKSDAAKRHPQVPIRHFAIYLDGWGLLEVAAASWDQSQ